MSNVLLQYVSLGEEAITRQAYADFRIRSDVLVPESLSVELGVQPTLAWAKGERYLGKELDPATKQIVERWAERPWGMWHINSKAVVHSKKVEDHLAYLLDIFEPKRDRLIPYLQRELEYSISVYIRWEPSDVAGSYRISSGILTRTASLCHYMDYSYVYAGSE
jgi:hypothetical protein